MDYDPQNFADLYNTPLGRSLWQELTAHDNIIRMETATYLNRVAVEPLGPILLREFGDAVRPDRVKQMIGHMCRQILSAQGYKIDKSNVRLVRKDLFTSGTRYEERSDSDE